MLLEELGLLMRHSPLLLQRPWPSGRRSGIRQWNGLAPIVAGALWGLEMAQLPSLILSQGRLRVGGWSAATPEGPDLSHRPQTTCSSIMFTPLKTIPPAGA